MPNTETKSTYKDLAAFCHNKSNEPAGGSFFSIYHAKAPTEHGVWGRSKAELEKHLNKIRKHFVKVVQEV